MEENVSPPLEMFSDLSPSSSREVEKKKSPPSQRGGTLCEVEPPRYYVFYGPTHLLKIAPFTDFFKVLFYRMAL